MKFRGFMITALFWGLFLAPRASIAVDRFAQIDDNLFRGSQPETSEDFKMLKRQGFKLVINLGNKPDEIAFEKKSLKAAGIEMISSPMDAMVAPDQRQVEEVLKTMHQAPNGPKTYLHCHLGKDRTGVISALYRVHFEGWSPEQANKEMNSFGFSKFLKALNQFFWDHTAPGSLDL